MSAPREEHMVELKRLARYVRGASRHRTIYEKQNWKTARFRVYVDSDWAGDPLTRKSATGMIVLRGKHLLRHTSTLQSIQALSSAEAEFYAMTKGGAYGLGMQAYFMDFGIETKLELFTDSSPGKAFAERRGLGKLRHVQTRYLWLQDRVAFGHILLRKVLGTANPADILTKQLTAERMQGICRELGEIPMS